MKNPTQPTTNRNTETDFWGGFQYCRCSPWIQWANLNVLGNNCYPFSVDGAEVGVFHEAYYICLCSFLQAYNSMPWKCRSYFPTSRAILQTSHEKGSFQIRSSVLFWNCQISQRATVPDWYFQGFLTLLACKNSFQGALPTTVGWTFLQASSSPSNLDGPAFTAIWANCQVGNNDSDLPSPSSCSASAILLIISPASGGTS